MKVVQSEELSRHPTILMFLGWGSRAAVHPDVQALR